MLNADHDSPDLFILYTSLLQPTRSQAKLVVVQNRLADLEAACGAKLDSVCKLLELQELVETVGVALQGIADGLCGMGPYPLQAESVQEGTNTLQVSAVNTILYWVPNPIWQFLNLH